MPALSPEPVKAGSGEMEEPMDFKEMWCEAFNDAIDNGASETAACIAADGAVSSYIDGVHDRMKEARVNVISESLKTLDLVLGRKS